ncbi:hypothetical protein [Emticicia agri]|uniref:Uncharacterized protein n=1 Tax=Emticicia agri TaxID=2492393 RepID=A0A4Q5LVZ4_9BACT|nr:hypothetical protein [Emticicia agri]RYU93653.1 hypothetical protein EWM59_21210 [Emticicia agri]
MFFFRINKVKIFDNREKKKFLGIFGRDLAQVKFLSFVSTEFSAFPDLSDFLNTNNAEEKKAIIKKEVENVIASRIFTEIQNVKDNHVMTFGDTGFVLYQSAEIPVFFDWQFIAFESDERIRDTGRMVEDILNDNEFDKFTNNLGTLVAAAANPAFSASVEITKFALKVISKITQANKDEMIGILMMSLNRVEHYPHGERKKDDVPDLTNNMFIDYSLFGF